MLVTEDKMTEGDGILISHLEAGLGLQLAAAFKRLGRRVAGSETTLSPTSYGSLFLMPQMALSLNRTPDPTEIESLKALAQKSLAANPRAHLIWVLPLCAGEDLISDTARVSPSTTVLLAPAVFGFGDGALMETALTLAQENPGTLTQPLPPRFQENFREGLLFSGDLAALLVSVPGQRRLFGKKLRVPATTESVQEWKDSFQKHFTPRISWFQKSKALLSRRNAWRSLAEKMNSCPAPESFFKGFLENALDYFPTSLTPLDRVMKNSAEQYARNPELNLHFPPARAL
jgi:hypothetical protein